MGTYLALNSSKSDASTRRPTRRVSGASWSCAQRWASHTRPSCPCSWRLCHPSAPTSAAAPTSAPYAV
eukprot:2501698-Prymnesium_polylepis.1